MIVQIEYSFYESYLFLKSIKLSKTVKIILPRKKIYNTPLRHESFQILIFLPTISLQIFCLNLSHFFIEAILPIFLSSIEFFFSTSRTRLTFASIIFFKN